MINIVIFQSCSARADSMEVEGMVFQSIKQQSDISVFYQLL